eukprot:7377156-Prymnesium_polylepis.2
MALAAAFLLGGGWLAALHHPADEYAAPLRLRVSGQPRPPHRHAAHRPLLHDAHHGAAPAPRRAAAGPRRHGQDRDGQGSEQESCKAVHRLQLLRRPRLQVARPHVLRPRADGRV